MHQVTASRTGAPAPASRRGSSARPSSDSTRLDAPLADLACKAAQKNTVAIRTYKAKKQTRQSSWGANLHDSAVLGELDQAGRNLAIRVDHEGEQERLGWEHSQQPRLATLRNKRRQSNKESQTAQPERRKGSHRLWVRGHRDSKVSSLPIHLRRHLEIELLLLKLEHHPLAPLVRHHLSAPFRRTCDSKTYVDAGKTGVRRQRWAAHPLTPSGIRTFTSSSPFSSLLTSSV